VKIKHTTALGRTVHYIMTQKHQLMSTFLPNIDQFSIFFHWHIQQHITHPHYK